VRREPRVNLVTGLQLAIRRETGPEPHPLVPSAIADAQSHDVRVVADYLDDTVDARRPLDGVVDREGAEVGGDVTLCHKSSR
jgi:hypothetical protein